MTRRLAFCIAFAISTSLLADDPESIVYDFSAVWCGPCQQMAPLVARLEREGLPIRKVDIDKEKALAAKYNISSIPTFVVVIHGEETERHSGGMTETDLRKLLAKLPENPGANIAQNSSTTAVELGEPAVMNPMRTASNSSPETRPNPVPNPQLVVRGNDAETGQSTNGLAFVDGHLSTDPMASSVRIRVTVEGKVNLGSGTIIHSQEGMSKILTCAHIFRGFNEDSKIEVDLTINNKVEPYIGRLDDFNEEADLGLISVATSSRLPVAAIASLGYTPSSGDAVLAIGCSGGDAPTRENLKVTAIDRYVGPHNIECTGLPVQGRSGGGLFNAQGQIVGVCIAADKEQKRGLYSGLFAVQSLLEKNGMAKLFRTADATSIAHSDSSTQFGNESSLASSAPAVAADWTQQPTANSSASPDIFSILANEKRTKDTVAPEPVDLNPGGAEVVVIIRDPNHPGQQNRVVIIHDASPKFLSYLNGELGGEISNTRDSISQRESIEPPHLPVRTAAIQPAATQAATIQTVMHERLVFGKVAAPEPQLQPTSLTQPLTPRRYVRSTPSLPSSAE